MDKRWISNLRTDLPVHMLEEAAGIHPKYSIRLQTMPPWT